MKAPLAFLLEKTSARLSLLRWHVAGRVNTADVGGWAGGAVREFSYATGAINAGHLRFRG